MVSEPLLSLEMAELPLFKKGKVRNVYRLGEYLLVVATDRISAFDVVMPNGIPNKGRILTEMCRFWFDMTSGTIENHLITCDLEEMASIAGRPVPHPELLEGRSMLVRETSPYPVECVVRGYLAGSWWEEYCRTGAIAGVNLPGGLQESAKLPEPIFTPSTKEESGHDRPLTQAEASEILGDDAYQFLSGKSIEIYKAAAGYAEKRNIIIADTKFEFGLFEDRPILIDEILTPDSSRFWPLRDYHPGRSQKSFDKQFVRDYLESTGWDKKPPAPALPEDIVRRTVEKYQDALKFLTESSV